MNPRKVLAIYEEIGVTIHGFSLCSGLRAAPGVAAPGARPPPSGKSPKLTNPHFASRELRANFQLSTHRLDGFAQHAHNSGFLQTALSNARQRILLPSHSLAEARIR
jgi:hypothetical protein